MYVYISQPQEGLTQRQIKEDRMEAELEVTYFLKEQVKFTNNIKQANIVYMSDGWDLSSDCRKDHEYATEHNIEIIYC